MSQFAYGDSYGGVAQNELAMDAARDSRYFNTLSQRLAIQRLIQDQQQNDFRNSLAASQTGEENRRFYGYELPMKQEAQQNTFLDRLLQRQQAHQDMLSREKIAAMHYGDVNADQDYAEAHDAVLKGLMTPDKAGAMFPSLTPAQRNRLQSYFNILGQRESADVAPAEAQGTALSDALNEELSGKRLAKGTADLTAAATKAKSGLNWLWGPNSESSIDKRTQQAIKDLTEGRGRGAVELDPAVLAQFVDDRLKRPAYNRFVQWDPGREAFVPTPIPRNFSWSSPLDVSGPRSSVPSTVPATGPGPIPPAAGTPIMPQSKAEFEMLPRGALYTNPADGKIYRKR